MRISTKGRYALRMMIDLAVNQGDDFVALKDTAKRQEISKKYLEQIVSLMNKSGMLKTSRGNQGGYRLLRSADKYTVGEILRVTEGSLAPVACLEYDPVDCERAGECTTLFVWRGLYKAVTDYLDSITLQDIIEKNTVGNDYYI